MKRKAVLFLFLGLLSALSAGAASARGKQRPQVDQLWKCVDTWTNMLAIQTAYAVDYKIDPKVATMEEPRALVQRSTSRTCR